MSSNSNVTPISDATRRVLETKGPTTPEGRVLSRSELVDTIHDGSVPVQVERYVEDRVPLNQNLLPQTQVPLNFSAGGFQQGRVIRSEHINAMQDGAVRLRATADGTIPAASTREPVDGLQELDQDSVQRDDDQFSTIMRPGPSSLPGIRAPGGSTDRRTTLRDTTAASGSRRSAQAQTTAATDSTSTSSARPTQATVTRSGRVSAPTRPSSSSATTSGQPLASTNQGSSGTPTYFTAPALPSAPRRSRPSRAAPNTGSSGTSGSGQVRTAYVDAHPNENFYHGGQGRWNRGLPPLWKGVRTAVRGPGRAAWLQRARAYQALPTANSHGGGGAAPAATRGGVAGNDDDEDDDDDDGGNGDEGDNEDDVDGEMEEDDNEQEE